MDLLSIVNHLAGILPDTRFICKAKKNCTGKNKSGKEKCLH